MRYGLPFFWRDYLDKTSLTAIADYGLDECRKVFELIHSGSEDGDPTLDIVVVVVRLDVDQRHAVRRENRQGRGRSKFCMLEGDGNVCGLGAHDWQTGV